MQTRAHYERTVRNLTMVAFAVPLLFIAVPRVSAASQGPLNAGTLANDSSYGNTTWTNPGNSGASDNVYATANTASTTHYLKATNFGFTIPGGATINGIILAVELKDAGGGSMCRDSRVRIVKGGTVGATDKSYGGTWGASENTRTYGSSSDLWGETWTATNINATNFGGVISGVADSTNCDGSIDAFSMTVHYTDGAVPELSTWAMLILFAVAAFALHREGLILPGFVRSGIHGDEG